MQYEERKQETKTRLEEARTADPGAFNIREDETEAEPEELKGGQVEEVAEGAEAAHVKASTPDTCNPLK